MCKKQYNSDFLYKKEEKKVVNTEKAYNFAGCITGRRPQMVSCGKT